MTAKDIKNAILQEAVQGKLVPQIASEGNAKDLLEEIRKEKAKFVKEGKLKKEKPLPDITEDDIPFDIPENWCWCRLEEIVDLRSGNQYKETSSGTLYLKVADLNLQENFYEIKTSTRYTNSNDDSFIPQYSIIFPKRGGAIATNKKKLVLKEKVYVDSNTMGMTPKNKDLLPYLNMWFDSIDLGKLSSGTSVPQINNKDLLPLAFPLPPLAEQKRIVAAIEKFMPLIEEYGKKETELKAFNEQIGTLTKKAILQEAVQGKLVPQIAAEGNAKNLLEEIKKEKEKLIKEGKIKKDTTKAGASDRALLEITEDEIPFDIPENWCWCRLGEIVPFGTCQNAEPSEIKEDDWILDLEDIEKDSGKILAFKTKKQVDSKSTKHIFKEGYVLYSKLRLYLNKCVIAPKDGFCTSEILPLDFGDKIYNKYAQIYLMSPFFVEYTNSLSFGVKMPRLGTEDGKRALFPLPPLAEQKRIVAAIEKMLPLCEKLGV